MDTDELIGSAYDAVLEPERWPSVLEHGCRLLSANMGILRVIDREGRDVLMLGQGACLTADLFEQYRTNWMDQDIHLKKVFMAPVLWNRPILAEMEIASSEEERSSPYVNEFLRPVDLGRIVTAIWKGKTGSATAAFHRSLSAPLVSREALQVGQTLLPHLIRAARMTASQLAGDALRLSATSLFGNAQHAVLILDDRAHVLWVNSPAEALLAGRQLRVNACGALSCTGASARLIESLIADAAAAKVVGLAPRTAIFGSEGAQMVMRGRVIGRETWPRVLFQRASILVECAPLSPTRSTAKRLIDAFGLTPAEAEVALDLAEDIGVAEIARMRRVSEETVRSQSQAIFRKVGVSRRPALVRIVAKLSD